MEWMVSEPFRSASVITIELKNLTSMTFLRNHGISFFRNETISESQKLFKLWIEAVVSPLGWGLITFFVLVSHVFEQRNGNLPAVILQ